MKTTPLFFILLLSIACSKDDATATKSQTVTNTAITGTWIITSYIDSGVDETVNFIGYTFEFKSSGVVTATRDVSINGGTWSVTDTNSSDDTFDDLHFNLAFTNLALLQGLNSDWEIVEVTSQNIKLTDVSGGGGGTDFLTFYKN